MDKKQLNIEKINEKMIAAGLSQTELAKKIDVSKETISQWLKGKKYPRPSKLLLLSKILKLTFNEIVLSNLAERPVIAYRSNKNKKLTEEKIVIANDMGEMLKVLLPYLNIDTVFTPARIKNPVTDEAFIEKVTFDLKKMMGIKSENISFADIMNLYNYFRIVFIPVLWGIKGDNGLSVHLPKSDVTFVYANLEKNITDFKYWLLHELSHAITPSLSGKESEHFAERFAAIFLSPQARETAARYYGEINNYAALSSLPGLDFDIGGAAVNFNKQTGLVSNIIFNEEVPDAEKYIKICTNVFKTDFFNALSEYIRKEKKEAGVVQRLMNIPIADAKGVHKILAGK